MYGVKIKIKVLILIFCIYSVSSEVCDSSSDVTQCLDGQICRSRHNLCEEALYCGSYGNNRCAAETELTCISDYCQPDPCTSTGQCVHGHVCEQNNSRHWNRICVYPIVYNVEEGSEVILAFKEPATPGSYDEIQWYKGGRNSFNRAAVIHPIITDNKIQYYNELCSGDYRCNTSTRAHLNRDTGELTIHSVKLRDESFYYYQVYIDDGFPDTGDKYEYKLNVYVVPEMIIQGIPQHNYVEVRTSLTLTCTADRIRPHPLAMYWEINGRNVTGTITTRDDDGDGVFSQTSVYLHRVTEEDEGGQIRCILIPRYGQTVTVEKYLNLGYAPSGSSYIKASALEQHIGERVTLTCENPPSSGKPDCDLYTWRRLEGNINFTPETQIYTFIMDEFHAGNYTCQCGNVFGESDVSIVVEIVFLGERPEKSSKGGLIAGCVIGVLVLAALVIVGVIVCKRYKVKFNMDLKFQPRRERAENEVDNGGYEDPVNNNVQPYEEVDNGENIGNQYQEVNNGGNIGNQYDVINGENNGNQYDVINGGNIGNQYNVINEDAMARPGDVGFVNPGMTTYEEIL